MYISTWVSTGSLWLLFHLTGTPGYIYQILFEARVFIYWKVNSPFARALQPSCLAFFGIRLKQWHHVWWQKTTSVLHQVRNITQRRESRPQRQASVSGKKCDDHSGHNVVLREKIWPLLFIFNSSYSFELAFGCRNGSFVCPPRHYLLCGYRYFISGEGC